MKQKTRRSQTPNKSTCQLQRRPSYQLNGGKVLLPPEELLVLGAHGGQAIVNVHDNMDHTVEQSMERSHPT